MYEPVTSLAAARSYLSSRSRTLFTLFGSLAHLVDDLVCSFPFVIVVAVVLLTRHTGGMYLAVPSMYCFYVYCSTL